MNNNRILVGARKIIIRKPPLIVRKKKRPNKPLVRRKPAPQLPISTQNLDYFPELAKTYVISIRPTRYKNMCVRMGKWAKHLSLVQGTHGATINIRKWIRHKKMHPMSRLKRGELGCYDSHVRIWRNMVHTNQQMCLILEDDANIRYTPVHYQRIRNAIDEANAISQAQNRPWHLLYLGTNKNGRVAQKISNTMVIPRRCNGLFAYILTLEGAKILLANCTPYRRAVDSWVGKMHDKGFIFALAMRPKLCYVVPVYSDTAHIV